MLKVCADAAAVAREAAGYVASAAGASIEARGGFDLCLAGGSTPRAVHAELVSAAATLRWDAVRFYFGDERAVAPDDPESNYRMANETLFVPLGVAPENVHRMQGEAPDLAAAAAAYEAEVRAQVVARRADGVPAFDLMLLGLGGDAHTASLFPRTAALWERRRLCVANVMPETGQARITATFPLVNAAERVVCVAVGESKADALARVLEAAHDVSLWPAQGIDPDPGELIWFVDVAAASGLQRPGAH